MVHREAIEWSDVWVTAADMTGARRVLLIGDSIARSYYPRVQQGLAEEFACARLATSRCVCDPMFEKELELVLDEYDFAAIHFNNGLHGWAYTEEQYSTGLAATLDFLRHRASGSTLIWASTTPVRRKDDLARLDFLTERVRERNRIAAELCRQHSLPVNDLFGLVIDHPECYSPDGVHFNADGQSLLGEAVARCIEVCAKEAAP